MTTSLLSTHAGSIVRSLRRLAVVFLLSSIAALSVRVNVAAAQTVRVAAVARAALPDSNAAIVVRASMKQFAEAWNRADAAALAQLFTDDGDLVIPEGLLLHGRQAVQDFYASVFARGFAGSTTQADVAQLRAIAPGVMLLDATWSITGAKNAKGEPRPAERGILAAVVVKRAGRWQLAALREQEGAVAVTPFAATSAQ